MKKLFRSLELLLGVITAITVFFGVRLPRTELDNNNIRFLPEEHEARVSSAYIDDTFGGSSMIFLGPLRPYGCRPAAVFGRPVRRADSPA
jgi:predicted RND superfamily exporter protein